MSKKHDMPETIAELIVNKSNLLLEASVLIGTGELEQAIERYALAAPMEARIARYYARAGEKDMAARHGFSAGICYAKSGSLRHALKLFDALSWEKNSPGQYKGYAILWAARLRQQQRDALQAYGHPMQSAA